MEGALGPSPSSQVKGRPDPGAPWRVPGSPERSGRLPGGGRRGYDRAVSAFAVVDVAAMRRFAFRTLDPDLVRACACQVELVRAMAALSREVGDRRAEGLDPRAAERMRSAMARCEDFGRCVKSASRVVDAADAPFVEAVGSLRMAYVAPAWGCEEFARVVDYFEAAYGPCAAAPFRGMLENVRALMGGRWEGGL